MAENIYEGVKEVMRITPDRDKGVIRDNLLRRFKMKTRYLLHALFIVCAIGGLSGASPAFSDDNIERSCKAHYTVYLPYKGHDVKRFPYGVPLPTMRDSEFSARRGCGRTVPNRCRKRALEAIMQCMVAHTTPSWGKLMPMPAACTSNGVENYRITDLEKAVQETVCSHLTWDKQKGRWDNEPELSNVSLHGDVSGGEGCDKHVHLNYFRVSCPPPPR